MATESISDSYRLWHIRLEQDEIRARRQTGYALNLPKALEEALTLFNYVSDCFSAVSIILQSSLRNNQSK